MGIKLSEHFNYEKLLRFTFPTIIMNLFTSLYGIVDGIFVSNFAGSDAFTAVNIMWPYIMIFSTIGFMVGTGGSALVSKTLGEEKKEKARRYFSMLIYFDIVVGVVVAILSISITRPLAKLFSSEGDILEYCVVYGRISFLALPVYLLQNSFQSFLVAAERPKLGLIISVLAGVTNMVLDVVLIYGAKLGIKGAAIATAVGQCVGGLIPLGFFMYDNGTPYRLVKTGFEVKPIAKACLNGLSEMMMNVADSVVIMLYNYQLQRLTGSKGIVVFGIITYATYIFISVFIGYSNGSAPIVSFHYGAKNTEELQNLLKRSLVIIAVSALLMVGLSEGTASLIAKIFVGYDPELYSMAVRGIRIYFISFTIMGFNIFASAFFTGLNNGIVSAIICLSRTLIFEATMIFVLPLIFGLTGVWMAISFNELFSLIVSITMFFLNRKKYQYF